MFTTKYNFQIDYTVTRFMLFGIAPLEVRTASVLFSLVCLQKMQSCTLIAAVLFLAYSRMYIDMKYFKNVFHRNQMAYVNYIYTI